MPSRPTSTSRHTSGPAPRPSSPLTSRSLLRTLLVVAVLGLAALVIGLAVTSARQGTSPTADGGGAQVVREDSHVLSQATDEQAVLVEFLDFECEVCRAYYPTVEALKEEYRDELTVVIRYFPIPAHHNSTNAALAVEAAALQGQLEPMYQRMYETQAEWGEQQESQADLFRGFAEQLGLDLEQYDAAVADPETAARVQRDFDEGRELGVGGTPTFFLDGQEVPTDSPADLIEAVQATLGQ